MNAFFFKICITFLGRQEVQSGFFAYLCKQSIYLIYYK